MSIRIIMQVEMLAIPDVLECIQLERAALKIAQLKSQWKV
jgi:hypothetical protein